MMAAATDQSIEHEYEDLSDRQRLRAAVHHTTMKICQETEDKYGLPIDQQAVAAITETVWRQIESFAVDAEMFANHARRSVISPEDVKMLVRRNPCLVMHIRKLHEEQVSSREEPKKRKRKGKAPPAGPAASKKAPQAVRASASHALTDEDADVREEDDD
ncbi:centromere protein S-like isoform X2 [Babylonia areolata]